MGKDNEKQVKVATKTKVNIKTIVIMLAIAVGVIWIGFASTSLLGTGGALDKPEPECVVGEPISDTSPYATQCCPSGERDDDETNRNCDKYIYYLDTRPYCLEKRCVQCIESKDCPFSDNPLFNVKCTEEKTCVLCRAEWLEDYRINFHNDSHTEHSESSAVNAVLEKAVEVYTNATCWAITKRVSLIFTPGLLDKYWTLEIEIKTGPK